MSVTSPIRIWARVRGGGVELPSHNSYVLLSADSRPFDKATEYVRADVANDLLEALKALNDARLKKLAHEIDNDEFREAISDGWAKAEAAISLAEGSGS